MPNGRLTAYFPTLPDACPTPVRGAPRLIDEVFAQVPELYNASPEAKALIIGMAGGESPSNSAVCDKVLFAQKIMEQANGTPLLANAKLGDVYRKIAVALRRINMAPSQLHLEAARNREAALTAATPAE